MLKARDLPAEFWEVALRHAVFIVDRVPFMQRGHFQTDPYQLWTGQVFDYSKIRIFGSRCYILKRELRKDLSQRANMAIYVGHAEDSNAYICYVPENNDFRTTADIRFQETATDVYEAQRTPDEMYNLREAFTNIGNFLATETS